MMTTQMAGGAKSRLTPPRNNGITLIAIYHVCVSILFLLGTVVMAILTMITGIVGFVEDPSAFIGTFILGVIAFTLISFCILNLVVAYGLWTQRPWGRVAAIALALVALVGFPPIGTIIGGLILWHLFKSEIAADFE